MRKITPTKPMLEITQEDIQVLELLVELLQEYNKFAKTVHYEECPTFGNWLYEAYDIQTKNCAMGNFASNIDQALYDLYKLKSKLFQ